MPTVTGSNSLDTLLAVQHQSVLEFGMDKVIPILQADVAAHNAILMAQMGELVEVTEDTQRVYGASAVGQFVEVDEFGAAPTQKPAVEPEVAFPLRKYQYNVGWTAEWFKRHTPADMAKNMLGAQAKHSAAITNSIFTGVFKPTNRTVNDYIVSRTNLSVKAMLNADGTAIPDGPYGETFNPATHTHYSGSATLTSAAVDALLVNVLEHQISSRLVLAINAADVSAFKALTPGFTPLSDSRINAMGVNAEGVLSIDNGRINEYQIGYYNQAEVWVKTWVPANYCACYEAGTDDKALCLREDKFDKGLVIAATLPSHPLFTQFLEAYFGVGAWTRTAAACLQFNNASYTDPT